MTNLEGRVIRRRRACPQPAGVRTDLEVMVALAAALGRAERMPTSCPRALFNELRDASAGGIADYAGITWERIEREHGVFWPCPSEDHPGTPRLFTSGFPTDTGRARFHVVRWEGTAETATEEFPLFLTTGRLLAHYQSGTQTRRIERLERMAPAPTAQLHPTVARAHGLGDGDEVTLSTRRGSARFRVELTPGIREDTVFLPFHWGGALGANRLTHPALDPVSRMPGFKVCAVRVEHPSYVGDGS